MTSGVNSTGEERGPFLTIDLRCRSCGTNYPANLTPPTIPTLSRKGKRNPFTRYNRQHSPPAHRIVGNWPPRRDMSEERPSQQEVLQNLTLDNGLETVDAGHLEAVTVVGDEKIQNINVTKSPPIPTWKGKRNRFGATLTTVRRGPPGQQRAPQPDVRRPGTIHRMGRQGRRSDPPVFNPRQLPGLRRPRSLRNLADRHFLQLQRSLQHPVAAERRNRLR